MAERAIGATEIMAFEVEGILYTSTRKGYYYKREDGKNIRIKEQEYMDAFAKKPEEAHEEPEAGVNPSEKTKAPRKAKKTARNAYWKDEIDGQQVILTEKQVTFLKEIPNDDFFESGLDSTLWIDVFCDTVSGLFNPMAVGAMISTLREKQLIYVMQSNVNGRKCKYFGFTDLGKEVAFRLGLSK